MQWGLRYVPPSVLPVDVHQHLFPDELLEGLAARGFGGLVVAEINTRKAEDRAEREADLAEALAFTRLHLAAPAEHDTSAFLR